MGGAGRDSWVDGLLAATGEESPGLAHSKLRSFRQLLLLIVAAEAWHALHLPAYRQDVPLHIATAGGLSPFLSPEELARLLQLAPGRGSGPYRVSQPLFLPISNCTWLAELVLAPLLLVPATRIFAAAGVIAFMLAIELAAREVFFGMMMVSLSLLYLPRDANRTTLPAFAAAIAYLLATSAGLLSGWSFG